MQQVVHHHPGLGVVEGVMRAFVFRGGIVLHRKQVRKREPYLRTEEFSKRFWRLGLVLIPNQIFGDGGPQFGITTNLDLLVVNLNGTEILRQTFIEPSLGRRIVTVQQPDGKVVRDGTPRSGFEEIQSDEVLIFAGEKKSRGLKGLTLAKRSQLVIGLVVFECEDG